MINSSCQCGKVFCLQWNSGCKLLSTRTLDVSFVVLCGLHVLQIVKPDSFFFQFWQIQDVFSWPFGDHVDIKWVQFIITFANLLFFSQVALTCGRNGTIVVGGHLWSIATFCEPCIVAHGHAGLIFICVIPLTGTKLLPAAVWEYLHCTDRWVLLRFKTQGKFFKIFNNDKKKDW